MYFNPFVTQLVTKEHMKDVMRQNEQTHLIRAVKGSGKSGRWGLPLTFALNSLLALFIRSHS